MLPLTDLFFSFEFVMGNDKTDFTWFDILGIFVIVIGLLIYAWGTRKNQLPLEVLKLLEEEISEDSIEDAKMIRLEEDCSEDSIEDARMIRLEEDCTEDLEDSKQTKLNEESIK